MPKLKKKSAEQQRREVREMVKNFRLNLDEYQRDQLKKLDTASKKIKREEDSEKKRNIHITKRSQLKRLADPIKAKEHSERNRKCQAKRLENTVARAAHRKRDAACHSRRLSDPQKREVHRKRESVSQFKRLSDPVKRDVHRERESVSQFKRLSDPIKRVVHRERESVSQFKRLSDPVKRDVHRKRESVSQFKRLSDPVKRDVHRKRESICQINRLSDPEKRDAHRKRESLSQLKRLSDPEKRALHLIRNLAASEKRLLDPLKKIEHLFRDREWHRKALTNLKNRTNHRLRLKICQKKRLLVFKNLNQHKKKLIKNQNKRLKNSTNRILQNQKTLDNYYKNKSLNLLKKQSDLVKKYLLDIKDGPFWECVSCSRIWFRYSVNFYRFDSPYFHKVAAKFIKECCIGALNDDEVGYLCTTCGRDISNGRIPNLSLYYEELRFPEIPPALQSLTHLEERFLAPRIPFMQIHAVAGNQQYAVKGRVVNVPSEVSDNIQVLPRLPHQTDVVAVALKKKTSFKGNYLFETVRPHLILKALEEVKDCPVFKEAGVTIDSNRFRNTFSWERQLGDKGLDDPVCPPGSDDSDEEDLQPWNVADNETFLLSEAIVFAPGEKFRPLPLFLDSHAESMSFIKLYGGKLRTIPLHLSYQNWVKSEIMRADRRCAQVTKLFYSSLKLRAQKIASSISFCLRKTKGPTNVTAQQALCNEFTKQLALRDHGFKIFEPDRGSPAFWEHKKKEVFAMIKQLGPPTFFLTLSPAETKWPELLVILSRVIDKKEISESSAMNMPYEEKARLIKEDPVTCARYFEYRSRKLFHLLKNKNFVFSEHPIVDFYQRVEFQQRGSPHIHCLLWLKNAPQYKEGDAVSSKQCAEFINKYVTCSSAGIEEDLIQFQRHKHTFTCRKKSLKGKKCRFNIPYFPMRETVILEPLDDEMNKENGVYLKNYLRKIRTMLDFFYKEGTDMSYLNFLEQVGISEHDYIQVLRSSIKRPTTFLRRSPRDVRINGFNMDIHKIHRANMDIQYITDTWSCAMYVLNYINKSKRGMSRLLLDAIQEVKRGNMTIREQLRHMANQFLNASEFSAQEAVYYILSMPLSMSSRPCIFINTSLPENRVLVVKNKADLVQLQSDATDIYKKNVVDHYTQRPDILDDLCLAEFSAYYTFHRYAGKGKMRSDSDCEEDYLYDEDFPVGMSLQLNDKSGYVTRRSKAKVIRYIGYKRQQDESNFLREQIMLFVPWRDEKKDVLDVKAFDKFTSCQDTLLQNKAKFVFDYDNCDLEDFERMIFERDDGMDSDQDEVVPTKHSSVDVLNEYEVLRNRTDEGDIMVDIGEDLGNKSDLTLPVPSLVPEDRYLELVRSLNDKQRRYLVHLLHRMKTSDSPVYECVLGGAGVGKSRLIEAIHQTLLRHFNKTPGTDLSKLKVLLCAPTGKAAFAIKGVTIHSAFALPLSQFKFEMPPLTSSVSNTLLSQFHQVKIIIMDEVSMVGSRLFGQIDRRLKQIFRSSLPFAGKSMILFGDFNQLAPVGDHYIFSPDLSNPYAELIGNPLWELFKFHNLTEIMRQKDDLIFATALNNLAVGKLTAEEIELFKSREVSDLSKIPSNALRLFRTNEEVQLYNNSILDGLSALVSISIDRVIGKETDAKKENILARALTMKISETYGLQYKLRLAVGLHYMVTVNINTADGLVNGAIGILKYIEMDSCDEVARLWLLFEEPHVGRETRNAMRKETIRLKLDQIWTPIDRICRNFRPRKNTSAMVCRKQFPIVPAEAITIHKSQGMTYGEVVVNIKPGFRRNELYVAFSRATKLCGLYLVGKFRAPQPADPLKDIVQTVIRDCLSRKIITFSVPFLQDDSGQTIICHNIQSLNKHFPDLVADNCYLSASIIILVETWTLKTDCYAIPNFVEVHRVDVEKNRHGYGIIVYCHENLRQPSVRVLQQFNEEGLSSSHNLVLLEYGDICILAGYRPKSTPFNLIRNHINALIDTVESFSKKIIILGDFNIDFLSNSKNELYNLLSEHNIKNKLANLSTTDQNTQIDICFSNILGLKAYCYESYFSYHKPVVCVLPEDISIPESEVVDSNNNGIAAVHVDEMSTSPQVQEGYEIDIIPAPPREITLPPVDSLLRQNQTSLPPGFKNGDGVSCYANVACHVLLNIRLIRESARTNCDSLEFQQLALNYREGSSHILDALPLRNEVAVLTGATQFARIEEQDVAEFLTYMAKAIPIIEQTITHIIREEHRCTYCDYYISSERENLVLELPVASNLHSLNEMVRKYESWKHIVECVQCGSSDSHLSRTSILPRKDSSSLLLVQLMILDITPTGVTKVPIYFDNLSAETVSVSGMDYQVSAIISHIGHGTDRGHYTCKLRTVHGGWVKANDRIVECCRPPVTSKKAYTLLLTR